MRKNKIKILLVLTLAIVVTSACGYEKIKKTKVKDMDYTVVAENEMPKEVKEIIEKRKDTEFQVTYSNNEYTYIIIGYGRQQYEGYSIKVKEMYESDNAIYIKTQFNGPKEYTNEENVTYPVIVVKTEYSDKSVIFNE